MTAPSDRGWRVEIFKTLWVVWGYGDVGVDWVEPAMVRIDVGDPGAPLVLELPFRLPSHHDGSTLPAPVERRRVHGVGWRVRSNYAPPPNWCFAADEATALAAAAAWCSRWTRADQADLRNAINDVRVREDPPPA